MIIRRLASTQQLITQPAHAALAARIMGQWQADHFPESPRKKSILNAVEQHDNGWADVDEALIVDPGSGRLLDFVELPDALKRDTAARGIDRLASDPYAAALVAQHRLHVYRRYTEHVDWRPFFASVAAARDVYLRSAGQVSLDELLRDYVYVRAGDLASLAFCNNWTHVDPDGCGYEMRLEGTSLFVSPDPFGGRTVELEIHAREIESRVFGSAAEARRTLAAAPVITLRGVVRGTES